MFPSNSLVETLRALFRKKRVESELDEEIRFHIEKEIEKNLASGMDPQEARRVAHLRLGGVEQVKELVRDEQATRPLADFLTDVRYTLRTLSKAPGFVTVVLITLAVGIGATGTLFSVVNSVLLNPLPFEDPDQLVFVWENREQRQGSENWVSLGNYQDWRRLATGFEQMAAAQLRPYNLTGSGDPVRLSGLQTTASLLPLFRLRPELGRGFLPEEEQPGVEAVCLLGHELWQTRFGGDPDLVGRALTLDGSSYLVVGILPTGFEVPGFGAPQVLTPVVLDPGDSNFRGNHNSIVFARLREGVSLERANSELAAVALRLEQEYPEWNEGINALAKPMKEQLVGGVRRNILVLFSAGGLGLLLACVNIANLLLARASRREREMTIRAALGASRGRLVRQVLTEAVVLACAGGLLGLLLCQTMVSALRGWSSTFLPRLAEISVDARVLAVSLGITLLTALVFGLLPALHLSQVRLRGFLSQSGPVPCPVRRTPTHHGLVAVEVALASILLVGSGLLLRSYLRLSSVELGFDSKNRVAMEVQLSASRYADRTRVASYLEQLVEELEALPSVRSAGASISLPFYGSFWTKHVTLQERPAATLAEVPAASLTIATPGYLRTLAIRLLDGRPLGSGDDGRAPLVALVNRKFAELHYDDRDPLGHRIRLGLPDHLLPPAATAVPPWLTIVGVVGDVRLSPAAEVQPEIIVPQRQDSDVARTFLVTAHTTGPSPGIADALRRTVWSIDPEQAVPWVRTLDNMRSTALSRDRLNLHLVGAFSLAALILAMTGVYGLVAQSASVRKQEIGIRLVLGASPGRIVCQVIAQGLRAAALGVAVGLALSIGLTQLMEVMLFGVAARDLLVLSTVPVLLLGVAVLASFIPACRVFRLDPNAVLRCE